MTPQLRFPEFTDEWQVKKLGDADLYVADGNYGEMYPKSSEMKDTGIPFIRANNLKNGRLIWHDMKYISPELHQVLKSGHLKTNDILITTRGDIGTTAFVTKDFDNANINAQICLLRSGDKLIPEFVFQTLQTRNSKKQVMSLQTGSALKQLPKGKLALMKFGVPSKPEQEKIADFLTAVDERIAVGEKKLELLETYKRGVMQKIFSQQIRFKDENGEDYPDWEEKKLGELVDIKSGSSKSEYIERNGANVIVDMGAISSDATLIDTKRTNFSGDFIETDELIMAKDDIGGGNIIGKVVMVPERNKFVLGDHVYKLSPHSVDTTFLYYAINSPAVNREFRKKANGTAQIGITNGTVTMQAIDVPCDDEQQKIADFLTTLDEKITAEKSKLTATREFKKALLQRMFV